MEVDLSQVPIRFLVPKKNITKNLAKEFYNWRKFTKRHADPTMDILNWYVRPESLILDLCCGCGRESVYFAERGHQVIGVDFSKEVIEDAKKQCGDNPRFIVGDAVDYKHDEPIDVAILHDALEHVFPDEVEKCIQNAISQLKNEGLIFIKIPTEEYKEQICRSDILEGHSVNPYCYQILDEVVSEKELLNILIKNNVELQFIGYKNFINKVPSLLIIIGQKVVE